MDRFNQQLSQLRNAIARPQIALIGLMLGTLAGMVVFHLLGAQMVASMLAGLAVSMLAVAAAMPNIWAQRRAAVVGAALLACACGSHAAIFGLALATPQAALFDKIAGLAFLAPAAVAALGHSLWRALPRR